MRRAFSAALALSMFATVLLVTPVMGATYQVSGSCVYNDPAYPDIGRVFYYQTETFQTRDAARDHVSTIKADCAGRNGRLIYSMDRA